MDIFCSNRNAGSNRNNFRDKRIYVTLFQAMLPVIVGVNGISVLLTPLFDGQSALRLLLTKDSPLIEPGLM